MLQFQILSGKKAGTLVAARHFPFAVGRLPSCDLPLDEAGVWDRHFQVDLRAPEFVLTADPNALVRINNQQIHQATLQSGDLVEIGSVKLRFGLSANRQKGLAVREWATWVGLAFLCIGQVAIIYWLLQW